ncbi:hypothetical protein D5018_07940 [Parashewanella curva]|uniref:Uncharacterized protein n=1 Tax=Parashewanella curva TaxID=2338552 RepID=A0A3L8Q075_9GAMM|nr:hypothetical protein [Parashewanella curva]RLV60188.1 hypothetical protein D5018_07940 [Parashewanella curva]
MKAPIKYLIASISLLASYSCLAEQLIPITLPGKIETVNSIVIDNDTASPMGIWLDQSTNVYMTSASNDIKNDTNGGNYRINFNIPNDDAQATKASSHLNFFFGVGVNGQARMLGHTQCTADLNIDLATRSLIISNGRCDNGPGLEDYQLKMTFDGNESASIDDITLDSARMPDVQVTLSQK